VNHVKGEVADGAQAKHRADDVPRARADFLY